MSKDDKVVGNIARPPIAKPDDPAAVLALIQEWRKTALLGDGSVFDMERMQFHIHGKHATLVGVQAIISVNTADLLAMLGPVLLNVIVPLMRGQIKMTGKPGGKAG